MTSSFTSPRSRWRVFADPAEGERGWSFETKQGQKGLQAEPGVRKILIQSLRVPTQWPASAWIGHRSRRVDSRNTSGSASGGRRRGEISGPALPLALSDCRAH